MSAPEVRDDLAQHVVADVAHVQLAGGVGEHLEDVRLPRVLLELARILTPGRGPSVPPDKLSQLRRDNPLAVFNVNWDPRRLWVTSFVEQARKVKLEGVAKDGEDVSEHARRMNLSDYFANVVLLPGKQEKDTESGVEVVRFSLEAEVKY